MKRCPTCSRVYDDDELRFCLDDGTNLVDRPSAELAPPTLVLPESQLHTPTMKGPPPHLYLPRQSDADQKAGAPQRKARPLLWVGVVILLLVVGSGALITGLLIYKSRSPLKWHLVLAVDSSMPDRSAAAQQAATVIESRLNALGLSNFRVSPATNGQITVDLPSVPDPERLKRLISTLGKLELSRVVSPSNPSPVQSYPTKDEAIASLNDNRAIPGDRRVLPYLDTDGRTAEKWVIVESPAIVTGTDIRTASAAPDHSGPENYQVVFSLKQTGADKFGAWTRANINQYLGVVLNDEVKSVAYIRSQITDQGVITGSFNKQAAEDLALILQAGPLPAKVQFLEERIDK
jgi:preprotein translocase subunit SecD